MCGIAGYFSKNRVPDSALLKRMCDRLQHRGPDAFGYYQEGPIALGHRRLSIIDVSGGAQPLGNEDGSLQIMFNGEIYNYRELREDLVKKGHRFATNSDTEVIVHLYEEVKERTPEYLNGMFALAIWDSRNQELFLARDRFGKKPLYYSTSVPGHHICFASELKALMVIPGFATTVNPQSVANALSLGYVPDPDTIFADSHKLPPGHSALVTTTGIRLRQYWKASFEPDESLDFGKSMEELAALSADAVERRMISDVPLGGFLSGGVDSSGVVAFMAQRAGSPVKTFSIGFTREEYDEVRYARMVAARYQTDHYEEVVSLGVHDMLRTLVEHYDEPFADSSAIPTLYLSRMTRQHVTVALSGDGADEILGGYRRYRFGVAEQRVRGLLPRWFRKTAVGAAARYYPKFDRLPQVFRAKATLTCLSQELGEAYFASMSGFGYGLLNSILSPELRAQLGGFTPRESFVNRFEKYSHLPPLQQMQAVDLETYLPGDILVKVDRASMAYSLEGRCPWLDYRIADLAGRMPTGFKLRQGNGKYIFKEMLRPHVPEEILTRRKMGFVVPRAEWFRTSLKPVFEALVLRPSMSAFLSLPEVRRVFAIHQSGARDYGRELWSMLMLACWENRWLGSGGDVLSEVTESSKAEWLSSTAATRA
jgi:asparagine synthase (glutamine-hydrolysing)